MVQRFLGILLAVARSELGLRPLGGWGSVAFPWRDIDDPHRVEAICRNLAAPSIRALLPSVKAPATRVHRLISRMPLEWMVGPNLERMRARRSMQRRFPLNFT